MSGRTSARVCGSPFVEQDRVPGVEDDLELGEAEGAVLAADATVDDGGGEGRHPTDDLRDVDVRGEARFVVALLDDVDVRAVVTQWVRAVAPVIGLPGHHRV